MSKSADYHAERLIESVQGAETLITEGVERLERVDEATRDHAGNMLGFLSVDVLRAQGSLVAYAPRLALGGLNKVARAVYHQRRYAQATGVDFYDAVPDAMDRLEI